MFTHGTSRSAPSVGSRFVGLAAALAATVGTVATGHVAVADETIRHDAVGDTADISLIGDSTLAGVRWYADYGPLQSYDFVFNAESCRRTVEPSCISREGYRSATVVETIHALGDELGDVLVVMTGYNDPARSIGAAITSVTEAASSYGVGHVVWLSLRAGPDVAYSDPQEQSSVDTFREYNEHLVAAAAESDGFVQVADWATYSTGAASWFEADGVHLTRRGVDGLTTFLAAIVQRVLAGEDVSPASAPWPVLVPGAEGETVAEVQRALIEAGIDLPGGADGIFGNDTMAAVAAYQRRSADLQVTGAVDEATARALGVHDGRPTTSEPAPSADDAAPVATPPPTLAATRPVGDPSVADDGATPAGSWRTAAAVVVSTCIALVAVGVVARRRYVVRRRRERRWARRHPATSPLRSVADVRRAADGSPEPVATSPHDAST